MIDLTILLLVEIGPLNCWSPSSDSIATILYLSIVNSWM